MPVDVVSLIKRIVPSNALPAYLNAVAAGQLQLKDADISPRRCELPTSSRRRCTRRGGSPLRGKA